LLTLLTGVLLALIPVVGFPVFRRHDELLATGYLLFRGALEMIGYAATAFVWLAMAQDTSVPASPGALNALAKLPDAAINPYVDIVFSLGALMLCWLLLRARLVPGWLAIWGLAGAALYLAQGIAAAFGSGEPAGTRAMFILAGLATAAFGVVLCARPGIGAVTLALLFGLFNLIAGIWMLAQGIELRRTEKTLHPVRPAKPETKAA